MTRDFSSVGVIGLGTMGAGIVEVFARNGIDVIAVEVDAPGIGECHARFECRLHETRITADYPLFVWRVVAAHAARRPKWPRTVHYRGDGQFMVSGDARSRRVLFNPEMLES